MSDTPKYQTIKVRFSTYRELRRLAAEKPETMAALLDRLVRQEQEIREARLLLRGALGSKWDADLHLADMIREVLSET